MDSGWKVSDIEPIARWKVGPRIWRVNNEWRLRIYRPWNRNRLIEVQTKSFLLAVYILGVGAGWWKDTVNWKAQ
jgi:hypothetical protein